MAFLITSPIQKKNRELAAKIDEIHNGEQEELKEKIGEIEGVMRGWQKKQYEPPNCDIVMIKHLNEQEKNRQAKQDLKEQLAMCDTYKLTREKLKLLQDLCKEHDMIDYTTTEVKRDDRQLIDQFVHSTHGAFQAYKKGSSINRTLH